MAIDWQGLWAELNERQQKYLLAIYEVDQVIEREETARTDWDRPPASEWRWMEFSLADGTGWESRLRQKLLDQQLVDPGTGATFAALESRGYIECRHPMGKWGSLAMGFLDKPMLQVKLTARGRRLVRAVTGQKASVRLPAGALREWHWQAMARLYQAYLTGTPMREFGGSGKRIGYGTFRRLVEYGPRDRPTPLARTRYEGSDHNGYLELTPFGLAYYEREYQRYRELYPGVAAPLPVPRVDTA